MIGYAMLVINCIRAPLCVHTLPLYATLLFSFLTHLHKGLHILARQSPAIPIPSEKKNFWKFYFGWRSKGLLIVLGGVLDG